MAGRKRPWSDLPQELLSAIANSLTPDKMTIVTFRSICHSWRSLCPPPLLNSSVLSPLLPLSIPLPPYPYTPFCNTSRSSCSFLSVTIIYALYRPLQLSGIESSSLSPDPCILFVDEFSPGKLSIRKPFFTDSYSTPINFPNKINMLDFNGHELGRFYNLTYSTSSSNSAFSGRSFSKLSKPRFCLTPGVNKVVMFPHAPAAITLGADGTLGMYRLNVGIVECENKHDGKGFRFDDIVEYKGRVLGIDRRGRVYQIKNHSSELIPYVLHVAGGGGRRKRLVESLGRLYLVVRCKDELDKSDIRIKFKVYELNEGRKKWVKITSLGDRFFSFGVNFSFSASAQELGLTCVKNCILFARYTFQPYTGCDYDYKVFSHLKKCELEMGVWHLNDAHRFGTIESYPAFSDSLWPPPSWIWNADRLVRIGKVEFAIAIMLDKVYENLKTLLERPGDYSVNFGQCVLEAATRVLNLKKTVVRYHQEEESKVMHDDLESMDIFIEGFKHILNKVYNLFRRPGTWSDWTTVGGIGYPDSSTTSQPCHDSHFCSTTSMLRKRHAFLFHIEEQATEVEMSLETLLVPVPTQ